MNWLSVRDLHVGEASACREVISRRLISQEAESEESFLFSKAPPQKQEPQFRSSKQGVVRDQRDFFGWKAIGSRN